MVQTEENKPQPVKARQINVRITAEQDPLLKQPCNRRHNHTGDDHRRAEAGNRGVLIGLDKSRDAIKKF